MLAEILKKLITHPAQTIRRYRAQFSLTELRAHEDQRLKAIGNALCKSLKNAIPVEERELIEDIEQRRQTLLSSTKRIQVIDYGAGPNGTVRSREEMDRGVHTTALVADICKASKPVLWANVLFQLIRTLKPSSCLELGSCVGISAAYQAAALQLNGRGSLITLEGSPEIAKIADETFRNLNLQNVSIITGPFHKTLKNAMEPIKPIDFFFNDGHHDRDAVIRYFNESLPYLADEAIIVFDDISWSSGMRKAWAEIENHDRVAASIDLRTIGIALLGNNLTAKGKFRIPV